MTVYLDVLFSINFFMNYILLTVCTALCHMPSKKRKRLLASLLGAIYGVCVFIPDLTLLYSALFVFLFSALMVFTSVCPCSKKDFLRCFSAFYISSFILSGAEYMLLPIFGGGIVRNGIIYANTYLIIAIALFVGFFAVKTIRRIRTNSGKYNIKVKYKDNTAVLPGILDTGNHLSDPISGRPVIVADETLLHKLFSPGCGICNLNEWIDVTDIRIIPYKTLDSKSVMTGFLAEYVEIGEKKIDGVIIAINKNRLDCGILISNGIL